jgi:hypothetical protein
MDHKGHGAGVASHLKDGGAGGGVGEDFAGPGFEEGGGEKGHVDGEDEVPEVGGVGEGGFDAGDGTAVGVEVEDEWGVGREGGGAGGFGAGGWLLSSEDVDFGAEAAKFGDGAGDEGATGELQQGFVLAHAGAAAAGEDVAADLTCDGFRIVLCHGGCPRIAMRDGWGSFAGVLVEGHCR